LAWKVPAEPGDFDLPLAQKALANRRLLHVLPVALLLVAALASIASASTRKIKDSKGDSKHGHADIKSVTAISKPGVVIWRIESYTDFKNSGAPCVGISLEAQKHPLGDELELCGNGVLQDFAHGGGSAGHAKVKRPNRHTIVYRVHRSHLKGHKRIAWAVQVRENKGCFPNICDQAPEGPGTHVVQRL
jgi:hypothetical protein